MRTYHFNTEIFVNDLQLTAEVAFDYEPAEDPTFYEPGLEATYDIVGFKLFGQEVPNFMYLAYEEQLLEDAEAYIKEKQKTEKEERAEYQLNWAA
jgi:hypothetical protein